MGNVLEVVAKQAKAAVDSPAPAQDKALHLHEANQIVLVGSPLSRPK